MVVAQLSMRSLPIPEDMGLIQSSATFIKHIYWVFLQNNLLTFKILGFQKYTTNFTYFEAILVLKVVLPSASLVLQGEGRVPARLVPINPSFLIMSNPFYT